VSRPAATITWIGHASVLLELDGTRVLTDPLLRQRVWHLVRQGDPPDEARLQDLDAIVLSHLHHDHLDLPSLRRLGLGARLVVPRGAGAFLRRAGFRDVTEVAAGEAVTIGSAEVRAVPADHDGRRRPGGPIAPALGYVVSGSARVYFAGDTGPFAGMAALADPELDVALLPVWGWGPSLGPGHLDPDEAATVTAMLQPRIAVPIHWGTYFPRGLPWRRGVALAEAPRRFAAAVAQTAPGVRVCLLAPGETLTVER
jgi:L-ascorbate metabolism protein UlaG (beta-lactamase superfamily)